MKNIFLEDIIRSDLMKDAIINTSHDGFENDYLVLHCLLKCYQSSIIKFLEIGTNQGIGTKIIKNALGNSSQVYSMDLPFYDSNHSEDYPVFNDKDHLGHLCDLPFIQIRSNSLTYNYLQLHPIDGWFIDGSHSYKNVFFESSQAIKSKARLIIWHDADQTEVYNAITEAFKNNSDYELFRVTGTRIVYAIANEMKQSTPFKPFVKEKQ